MAERSHRAGLEHGTGDAAAVAVLENESGSSPLLLVCEHASNHLPSRFGTLGLGTDALSSHIAWDPGALGVSRLLSRALDAPLVHATVSRLVLDLNRDPSAPDSIVAVSETTVVPGNRDLDEEERARRVRDVYHPFHDATARLVDERRLAGVTRAVVSVHSFTPVYRGIERPWHIGLIFARDDRMARMVERGLRQEQGLVVGMNEPYSPADRVFHTLERHAEQKGLAPLMIEIRNDLIREPDGQELWSDRLAPLLQEAVARI
jgi:predicted N-formylglutamate amidohydrolase